MIIDVKGPAGEIAVSTARKRHKVTVTAEAASKRSLAVDLARPTAIAGTSDYDALENRPQINGVLLTGDVGLDALGVPDSTSDLINDSGFITSADIPAIPTKTSDLQNDSGFITSADVPAVPTKTSELENDSGFITAEDIPPVPTKTSELENDSGFITSEDIPVIPTKTSELQNDSGFITLADLPIYNGGVL